VAKLQEVMFQEFIWTPLLNGPQVWKGDLWKIKVSGFHDNIIEYMTFDHRRCDELFAHAETLFNDGEDEKANEMLKEFYYGMLNHLAKEEEVLFPDFVRTTGMSGGPIQVMLMEHDQMRGLLKQMLESSQQGDVERAIAIGDTLMILIQQHNMKEEGILYPMINQHCQSIDNKAIISLQHFVLN
jgi:hemerythrin-like domain-containing protein